MSESGVPGPAFWKQRRSSTSTTQSWIPAAAMARISSRMGVFTFPCAVGPPEKCPSSQKRIFSRGPDARIFGSNSAESPRCRCTFVRPEKRFSAFACNSALNSKLWTDSKILAATAVVSPRKVPVSMKVVRPKPSRNARRKEGWSPVCSVLINCRFRQSLRISSSSVSDAVSEGTLRQTLPSSTGATAPLWERSVESGWRFRKSCSE